MTSRHHAPSRGLAAALSALLLTTAIAAHHEEQAYVPDVTVTLEGTLIETRFGDPHTLLQVQGPDGGYTVEWRPATELAAMGIDATMFRPNQYLIITGSPFINPRAKRVAILTELYRPEDGFHWRLEDGEPAFEPPRPLIP
jgi:hypothetical protein